MRNLILILAIPAIAASYWFGSQKATGDLPTTAVIQEAKNSEPIPAQPPAPIVDSIADIKEEMDKRSPLPIAEVISTLENWIQKPNALSQQFPLYDSIARAKVSDFSELNNFFETQSPSMFRETNSVLELRWFKEAPFALANHYYTKLDQGTSNRKFNRYNVIYQLALHSLADTLSFIEERESRGLEVTIEYKALFENARNNGHEAFAANISHKVPSSSSPQKSQTTPTITAAQIRESIANNEYSEEPYRLSQSLMLLAQDNALEAIAIAAEVETPNFYTQNIPVLLSEYSKKHPIEAFELTTQFYNDPAFSSSLHDFRQPLQTAINTRPETILEWYSRQADPSQANVQLNKMLQWVHCETLAALDAVNTLPHSQSRWNVINQSLPRIAQNDWDATNAWIAENLSPAQASELRPRMINAAMKQGIPEALKIFDETQNPNSRSQIANSISQMWYMQDPDSTIDWIQTLENPQTKLAAVQAISHQWVAQDSQSAKSFAEQSDDEEIRRTLLSTLARETIEHSDPEWILDNLDQFPDKQVQEEAAMNAINELALQNPERALGLISEMDPESHNYRNAISNLSRQWNRLNPLEAAETLWPKGGEFANATLNDTLFAIADIDESLAIDSLDLLATEELRQAAYRAVIAHGHRTLAYPRLKAFATENIDPNTAPVGQVISGWNW